jgi:hypothetical protein
MKHPKLIDIEINLLIIHSASSRLIIKNFRLCHEKKIVVAT